MAKSYATPYLRNDSTSTSATRAAETLTLPSSVLNASEGTVAGWFYFNNLGVDSNDRYLFVSGAIGTANSIVLKLNGSGSLSNRRLYFITTNAASALTQTNGGSLPSVGWHHVTARWNSNESSIWLDGVKIASSSGPNIPSVISTAMYIGSNSGGGGIWDGAIDELAIFNRALTDAEVYSLYAATQPLIDVLASDAQTLAGLTPAQITTNIPNTSLTGPLVQSLTAGQNISVSNPGGVGPATVGLTGVVPVANGGTGSATQNFVDLSTTQTVGGAKTFNNGVSINNGLAVNSGGATVYSGADFGLQAASGTPNDAGDFVFRNYDGSTRARVHAGTSATPQLTLQANGIDALTAQSDGFINLSRGIRVPNNYQVLGFDTLSNARNLAYIGSDNAIRVGDGANPLRLSSSDNPVLNNTNVLWHAGNASGGAWVWELFQGKVYAITNSSTSGNTLFSYDTGTSAGGATPTGGSVNYKFLWQAGLATGKSVYFEAILEGSGGTAYCALSDLTTSTLYGQVSTTATGLPGARVRSGAISLVDGHEYAIALWGSGTFVYMTAARLIII